MAGSKIWSVEMTKLFEYFIKMEIDKKWPREGLVLDMKEYTGVFSDPDKEEKVKLKLFNNRELYFRIKHHKEPEGYIRLQIRSTQLNKLRIIVKLLQAKRDSDLSWPLCVKNVKRDLKAKICNIPNPTDEETDKEIKILHIKSSDTEVITKPLDKFPEPYRPERPKPCSTSELLKFQMDSETIKKMPFTSPTLANGIAVGSSIKDCEFSTIGYKLLCKYLNDELRESHACNELQAANSLCIDDPDTYYFTYSEENSVKFFDVTLSSVIGVNRFPPITITSVENFSHPAGIARIDNYFMIANDTYILQMIFTSCKKLFDISRVLEIPQISDSEARCTDITVSLDAIFISDIGNHCIWKCKQNQGQLQSDSIKQVKIEFDENISSDITPTGLCFKNSSKFKDVVLISDSGNNRIIQLNILKSSNSAKVSASNITSLEEYKPKKLAIYEGENACSLYCIADKISQAANEAEKAKKPITIGNDAPPPSQTNSYGSHSTSSDNTNDDDFSFDFSTNNSFTDAMKSISSNFKNNPQNALQQLVSITQISIQQILGNIPNISTNKGKAKAGLQVIHKWISDRKNLHLWNSPMRDSFTMLVSTFNDINRTHIPFKNNIAWQLKANAAISAPDQVPGSIVVVSSDTSTYSYDNSISNDNLFGVVSWEPSIQINQTQTSASAVVSVLDISVWGSVFIRVYDDIPNDGKYVIMERDGKLPGVGKIVSRCDLLNGGPLDQIVAICGVDDKDSLLVYRKPEELPTELVKGWKEGVFYVVAHLLPLNCKMIAKLLDICFSTTNGKIDPQLYQVQTPIPELEVLEMQKNTHSLNEITHAVRGYSKSPPRKFLSDRALFLNSKVIGPPYFLNENNPVMVASIMTTAMSEKSTSLDNSYLNDIDYILGTKKCNSNNCTILSNLYCEDCKVFFCENCFLGHKEYLPSHKANTINQSPMPNTNTINQSLMPNSNMMNQSPMPNFNTINQLPTERFFASFDLTEEIDAQQKELDELQEKLENRLLERDTQNKSIDLSAEQKNKDMVLAWNIIPEVLTSPRELLKIREKKKVVNQVKKRLGESPVIRVWYNGELHSCRITFDPPCSIKQMKKLMYDQNKVEIPEYENWESEWVANKTKIKRVYRENERILYFSQSGQVGYADYVDGAWNAQTFTPKTEGVSTKFIFSHISQSRKSKTN